MCYDLFMSFLPPLACRLSPKKGFTLIELLITITIIAVLASIGIVTYTSVTLSARDTRRKLDLQLIAQALEVYYQKNGQYPITNWVYSSSGDSWISGLVPTYISSAPVDPKANGGLPWQDNGYGYALCSDNQTCYSQCSTSLQNGQWYVLATQLEDKNDPDRMEVRNYKWCDGNSMKDVYGWSKYSFVVTPK